MLNGPVFTWPARQTSSVDGKIISDYGRIIAEQNVQMSRLMLLQLVSQNPLPAGKFAAKFLGSTIGSTSLYKELFVNQQSYPVGVAVYSVFGSAAGRQVKLALTPDKSDQTVVDYLGNTAAGPGFGKLISTTVVLKPREVLYINTADTAFALGATDIFTPRVFDPAEYLADIHWQSRR